MSAPQITLTRILGAGQRCPLPGDRHRLLLPLRGQIWLDLNGVTRRLRRGELALLEPGTPLRISAERRAAALLIELALPADGDPRWPLLMASGLLAHRRLARAALRWAHRGDASDLAAVGFGLVDGWLQRCPGRSARQRRFRLRPLLRARRYLQLAAEGEGSLDQAASLAALSRCHFSRVFRRVFGLGPAAQQRHWRIEQALRELDAAVEPVWRAAQHAGFARSSSFARACRRQFAATPLQLRHSAARRQQTAQLG